MNQEINYGAKDVTFSWGNHWYKIPFFVLEDLADEMSDFIKGAHLNSWLRDAGRSHEPKAIFRLKEILKDEMPGMEAYRLYDLT